MRGGIRIGIGDLGQHLAHAAMLGTAAEGERLVERLTEQGVAELQVIGVASARLILAGGEETIALTRHRRDEARPPVIVLEFCP